MERDFGAIEDVGALPRVEIKDHGSRPIQVRRSRQQHMLFDIAKIRRPDERRTVVAEDVIDVSATLAARHGAALHPRRRVLRSVLFVKMLSGDALRMTIQSQRPVAQMGE